MMVPDKTNRDFAKDGNCLMVVTETKFDQKYVIHEYFNLNFSFII